jgi:DNA-binding winged helix-turn-helix (wHTH) protein
MTESLRSALSLALLDEKDSRGTAVQDSLRATHHQVVSFASTTELLAAMGRGQRFDLLLLASQDELTHTSLRAACEVLGLAILVIPQGGAWMGLPLWREAVARRMPAAPEGGIPALWTPMSGDMVRGAYRFIDESGVVFLRDREIRLSRQSFALASALFQNADRVLTREWLWRAIWKAPAGRSVGRVIDVCAAGVRKKLALEAENGYLLRSVYGTGYQLASVPAQHDQPAGEAHLQARARTR